MSKKTAPAPAPARRASLLAPPPEREPGIGAGLAAALYLALALLYFIPAFMPGKQLYGTDYTQAGYFFQDFLSRSFGAGHLPGWVPYVFGGVPMFANPGSAYYPVRFVADWLLPVKDILAAIFLAQFFIAGWGMYLLAREMGCRPWVAFVAGLCFQWTGILTSWVYAGHDGRIIVASLLPVFLSCLHRGVRTAKVAPFAGAAAAVGFALLSFQIQLAWYMLVAGLAWSVFCLVHLGAFRQGGRAARVIVLGIAAVAFGFAMAGVNFIPFQRYIASSPRAGSEGRGYDYSVSYSMPKANVAGMVAPEAVGGSIVDPETGQPALPAYHGPNGFKLHAEYLGATVLVLFGLGCWYSRRSRYLWFFAGCGLFFLTLAFGGNTPLYRLYWEILPGLKKFRAPDLAYFVAAFSMIAIAALGLEALARAREAAVDRKGADGDESLGAVPLIGAAVAIGALIVAAGLVGGGEGTAAGYTRFVVFAAAVVVSLWLWTRRILPPTGVAIILALVTVADLWSVGKKYFYTVPGPDVVYAADDVTSFLQSRPGPYRVWPVPGQSAWPRAIDLPMLFGIEQVGGEHGNQIQRYNEFLGAGEQASQPTFANVGNGSDARFRDAGDVRYLVLSAQMQDPSFREVYRGQQAIVYENVGNLGRAWLVGQAIRANADATLQTMQSPQWDPRVNAVVESPRDLALAGAGLRGTTRITRHEADHVEVATEANGAALLVLADNYYPDWKATVDGRPAEIYRTNHTFRGVVVPTGSHRVAFDFEPHGLYTGFYLYLATLGALVLYAAWLIVAAWRGRKTADSPAPEPAAA